MERIPPDEIRPGVKLYGYCGGYFERLNFSDKVIEAMGNDWVVVRDANGPHFASFSSREKMLRLLSEWTGELQGYI